MDWREYQRRQRLARFGDRFVSYIEEGSGSPVVLLHGIPTWGYLWYGQVGRLASTHRVLVPDLLGFGFSDRRDLFDRSIAAQEAMLLAFLDRLGLERVALVAHDIGGGVALRLAVHHPERLSSLVLMNTVCYDSWPVELMLQLGHPSAHRLLSASALDRLLRRALKAGFSSRPGSSFLDGLLAPWSTETGKLSLIRNASALNTNLTAELTPFLPAVPVRTLILWGADDVFQPLEYAQRLASDIPESRLVPIPDARHFVMVDQAQRVRSELEEFLA